MPSIVLNCPNCRQPYQMSPEQIAKYAGRSITCRKCKQPFAFDAAMDAAAQAAGQAEPDEEAASVAAPAVAVGTDEGQGAYAVGPGYIPPAATVPPLPPRRPTPPHPAPAAPPPAPAAQPAFPAQAYAPPPGAPAGYSPAGHPGGTAGGIGDLFGFQRMALPALLPLVFWLGAGYCLYNGFRLLLGFILVDAYRSAFTNYSGSSSAFYTKISFAGLFDRLMSVRGFYNLLDALFWIVLGPLFWRGFCDLILAASRLLAASDRK